MDVWCVCVCLSVWSYLNSKYGKHHFWYVCLSVSRCVCTGVLGMRACKMNKYLKHSYIHIPQIHFSFCFSFSPLTLPPISNRVDDDYCSIQWRAKQQVNLFSFYDLWISWYLLSLQQTSSNVQSAAFCLTKWLGFVHDLFDDFFKWKIINRIGYNWMKNTLEQQQQRRSHVHRTHMTKKCSNAHLVMSFPPLFRSVFALRWCAFMFFVIRLVFYDFLLYLIMKNDHRMRNGKKTSGLRKHGNRRRLLSLCLLQIPCFSLSTFSLHLLYSILSISTIRFGNCLCVGVAVVPMVYLSHPCLDLSKELCKCSFFLSFFSMLLLLCHSYCNQINCQSLVITPSVTPERCEKHTYSTTRPTTKNTHTSRKRGQKRWKKLSVNVWTTQKTMILNYSYSIFLLCFFLLVALLLWAPTIDYRHKNINMSSIISFWVPPINFCLCLLHDFWLLFSFDLYCNSNLRIKYRKTQWNLWKKMKTKNTIKIWSSRMNRFRF